MKLLGLYACFYEEKFTYRKSRFDSADIVVVVPQCTADLGHFGLWNMRLVIAVIAFIWHCGIMVVDLVVEKRD